MTPTLGQGGDVCQVSTEHLENRSWYLGDECKHDSTDVYVNIEV